jgi:maltooligosyltrehalose trehalohydrolase
MGEEYGETAPFPYFVDHGNPALIDAVRHGRAREFRELAEQGELFDPADEATFAAAKLDRTQRHISEHAALWELYRDLIDLRRSTPALRRSTRADACASASAGVLTLIRFHDEGTVAILFNLNPRDVHGHLPSGNLWSNLLVPEEPLHDAKDPVPLAPWSFCAFRLLCDAA